MERTLSSWLVLFAGAGILPANRMVRRSLLWLVLFERCENNERLGVSCIVLWALFFGAAFTGVYAYHTSHPRTTCTSVEMRDNKFLGRLKAQDE
jgi:hypothetical protein